MPAHRLRHVLARVVGKGGGTAEADVECLSLAKLEPERARIWGVLESDRSAVRRDMLEKYKIDFEQYKR